MTQLFSTAVVRLEPLEMVSTPTALRGLDAVRDKSGTWADDVEVTDVVIDGPFVGGARFAVRFAIQVTLPTGKQTVITKMELNTVKNGRIVQNEVFYNANPDPGPTTGRNQR